jgi:hypothetical protein
MRVRKEIQHRQEFLEEIIMSCNIKGYATILLALALSVCMVSAVFAEGGKQQKGKNATFTAAGQVVAIDSDSSPIAPTSTPTITLVVDKAHRLLKEHLRKDKEVKFVVSGSVKVKTEGSDVGSFDLSLDDLDQDDYVRVLGKKLTDGTFLITHIVVYLEE